MIDEIIKDFKVEVEKVLEHMQHELRGLRTGRANPALLHSVMVDSYGSSMPLSQLANIGTQDARTLVVTPWDKGTMQAIEKGIQMANLGLNPSSDGQVIRINLPSLTEERRKEIVKVVGQTAEKAKIGIRNAREDAMKSAKRIKEDGDITEDELEVFQKNLQTVVDDYNGQVKKIVEEKEQEVMTV